MDMAVRLRFAAGNGSLELGLQSFNCCRHRRIFSPIVPLRPRLWNLRLKVRAAEETDANVKEGARVKRESRRRPFSEYVLLLELRNSS